jgi:nucleotide sugar dehydrogenase
MKIGIIGNGFVGKATKILESQKINIITYDIVPNLCIPIGLTLEQLCETCDIIFISVPTPTNKDGSCHLNILEKVIDNIKEFVDLNEKIVVIRSTIPPGTSDNLNCYFMPEFLTEKNFERDFIENKDWIFGLKNTIQDVEFMEKINYLINTSFQEGKIKYNNINYLKNKEAEMVKLFRNNFLALKVSFCNEIAEFCKLKDINYENVRQQAVKDQRIGGSHSQVPGHDGHCGYGGTCFPKDSKSLLYEMNKISMKSYIIQFMDERNDNVDRKEADWKNNKGRSVID